MGDHHASRLKEKGGDIVLKRKYLIIGFLAFCLTTTLFIGIATSGKKENPLWATISELQTKVDSLNASLLELQDRIGELENRLAIVEGTPQKWHAVRGELNLEFYLDENCTIPLPTHVDLGSFGFNQGKITEFWIRDVGSVPANVSWYKKNLIGVSGNFATAIDYWDGSEWIRWFSINNPQGNNDNWYMDSEFSIEGDPKVLHCRHNVLGWHGTIGEETVLLTQFRNNP